MRVRHLLSTGSSRATVTGERAFFLRNKAGDFLTLFPSPQTRYAGWFVQDGARFIKVLEHAAVIAPDGSEAVVDMITTTDDSVIWEYSDGLTLTWKMSSNGNGVLLCCSKPAKLRLTLDMRPMYVFPDMGRNYHSEKDGGSCLVSYEDAELGKNAFLHLRSKGGLDLIGNWVEHAYPRDLARDSAPTSLFVYELGTVTAQQISFGFGWDKQTALKNSLATSRIKCNPPRRIGINHTHATLLTQNAVARTMVRQSLDWLQTENGMYAGLPWFHQVWSRDELIAALGLSRAEQIAIIRRYINLPLIEGELPTYTGSGTTCADGLGWLCLLIEEVGLDSLDDETHAKIETMLVESHQQLKQYRQAAHGLIFSGYNATWMDTIGREGYRIEIQAMYALLLSQLFRLTSQEKYQQERISFIGKIRQLLFAGGYFHDGLGDPSKRPNVFLAYLIQPDLLTLQNWVSCFDKVLRALSTPWGGLASLDSHDPRFQAVTTGENNRSYHNGDSWFFVNNLAAIALHRLDARRYGTEVISLLQSSTNEVLFEHMVGRPGEISSASHLDSFGCGIQAFSGGAYLALLNDLEGYSAGHERDSTAFFWEDTDTSS